MLPHSLPRPPLVGATALAILCLSACAPITSKSVLGQPDYATDDIEASGYADGLPPVHQAQPTAANARKLGDNELTCAQIYAETQALEKTAAEQQAKLGQAQQEMAKSQGDMAKQGNGVTGAMSALGNGLLGNMSPRSSVVAGVAMQAAAAAQSSAAQKKADKLRQTQTEMVNTEQALQQTQARSDYLATLFLDKDCKLSDVQAAASAATVR